MNDSIAEIIQNYCTNYSLHCCMDIVIDIHCCNSYFDSSASGNYICRNFSVYTMKSFCSEIHCILFFFVPPLDEIGREA